MNFEQVHSPRPLGMAGIQLLAASVAGFIMGAARASTLAPDSLFVQYYGDAITARA
jgi:hypothetical protein